MVGGSLRGYPASSTTKTDRHDKAEILLKVALNTINQIKYTFMNLGSRYFGHFANTSSREVLSIMLKSPGIAWPAGLYVNGEHAQVYLI
jgi:hypothetical protein